MGIQPDADDRVLPSPSAPLHDGSTVSFEEVRVVTRMQRVTIPFEVHTEFTAELVPGTVKVIEPGVTAAASAPSS